MREPDGLALSSRNAYLSPAQREQALTLSRSLRRADELASAGERDAATILAGMGDVFAQQLEVEVDYVALVDPETFEAVEHLTSGTETLAAVAARVGATRLIDNRLITPAEHAREEQDA